MRIVIKYSMVTMINSKWKQVSRKELKISKNLCSNFSRIISNFFKWQLIKKNYANLCNHYFLIKLQLDYSLNKIQTFTPKYGRNCAWNRDEEFVPFCSLSLYPNKEYSILTSIIQLFKAGPMCKILETEEHILISLKLYFKIG